MTFLPFRKFGWHRSIEALVAVSFLTIVGFAAICVSVMLDMRHSEEALARQTLENLATAIAADISRNIEIYDLSLRAVANNLAAPEIDSVSRELRQLILFDNAATAKHFGGIRVFGASGNLTIDAASLDPDTINVADEEFFRVHKDNPDSPLYISRPLMHRGALSIVLSRRINDPRGQFSGVASGIIKLDYFRDLFRRLKLGERDTITILSRDGIVLTRTPFEQGYVGRDLRTNPAVATALRQPSGSAWAASALDGVARLLVWRNDEHGLVVFVGKPGDAVYAIWNRQALGVGAAMGILILLAALMTVFLAREIARRSRAEKRLKELATTDGLTGLSNRRKFDRDIAIEWRRAARTHNSITLMMIDADHFKDYNDRHGHQAGDRALIAIADCIAASAARPGDCAARYGGEEFALLLPGVRVAEALRIAELLRLRAAGSVEDRPVTVSVGVATLSADALGSPAKLIEMADRALYEAKRSGRNCCRVADASFDAIAA